MNSLVHNIFKELQNQEHRSMETFNVSKLPFSEYHKIGISYRDEPIFFIKCSETGNSIDISLDLISVMFDRNCKIYENGYHNESIYTVIKLTSDNIDIQNYFIDVVCLILQQLPITPSQKSFRKEVDKIIDLFKAISSIPKKTIQGLWAEMLVIERANSPEILIKAWHASTEDKFDFNDGKDKIEVKSTSKSQRIHTFSIDQLNPNSGSYLTIVSLFVIQTGIGKSVLDLRNKILERVSDIELNMKLNELIFKTIGSDFDKITEVCFDYQTAIDSLKYFNGRDIPTINKTLIPNNISNVKFDVDLSNVEFIAESNEFIINSHLFKALGL